MTRRLSDKTRAMKNGAADVGLVGHHAPLAHDHTLDHDLTQQYNCVVIPPCDPTTGLLPPGIHETSWDEIVSRYGGTPHRRTLLAGLRSGIDTLKRAGCCRVYIDGSFITATEEPGDFDACWEVAGVQGRLLDPILLLFADGRAAQKAAYGGEFFIAESAADPHGTRYLAFFQQTRDGTPKGIVAVTIGEES